MQLSLFKRKRRRLDRGEPHCCLDCGRHDPDGSYGPPDLDEVEIRGEVHVVRLADSWLCARHSRVRWVAHTKKRAALAERRRRLDTFRALAAQGLTGDALFAAAEEALRR